MRLLRERINILKSGKIYADLHVHSSASDGLLNPTELVKFSADCGLSVLGITDHDTLGGIAEATQAADKYQVEVIPGIELSCGWEDRDSSIHVLGLFVETSSNYLCELLAAQKEARYHRALKIVELLKKTGIDTQELKEQFENSPEKVLGRPHIARFLLEKGHINSFQEAFDRFLSRGKPAYVPKDVVLPEKGIEAIQKSGGIAILAHPGLIPDWEPVWNRIKDLSWDGLETYYSEHTPSQVKKFEKIVADNSWLSTGGSDYHGDYGKHKNRLGKYGLCSEQYETLLSGLKKGKL